MKFKRWGNLVPQKHFRKKNGLKSFNYAPVEKGIYAFPAHYANLNYACGYSCLSNGRMEYVKDKAGRRVMMTPREFDAIEVKERGHDHYVVVSPSFLRGMDYDSLWLKKTKADAPYDHYDSDENEDNDQEVKDTRVEKDDGSEENADKSYPLMKYNNQSRIFNYDGNIWHHLETTEAYERWCRTPEGAAYVKRNILDLKDMMPDWEKALIDIDHPPKIKFKLLVKPEDIIRRSGSWILTSMCNYEKALKKAMHIVKFDVFVKSKQEDLYCFSYKPDWCFKSYKAEGRHAGLPNAILDFGEFEVFIEKVK